MLSGNPSTARNRYPFTAIQWQELEHQALIFKYMASGIPIPTDLIYSFKRRLDSSISSRLFPHHPIEWGCYETGFGRKIDPEPGRCRRTDGKKWRCSKEAYPDSKYCERHMHRGRNRSRKPVEISSSSSATPTTTTAPADYPSSSSAINKNLSKTSPSVSSYSLSPLSSISNETQTQHQTHQSNSPLYPFLNYPQPSSSSSRPPQLFSTQTTATPQLFLNSGSYNNHADRDYRYVHGGAKEGVDELAFFPESSATGRSLLTGGSSCQPLMSSCRGYSQQSHYQSLSDHNNNNPEVSQQSQEQQQQQHCFVWGTDFKSSRAIKSEKEAAAESQKSLHHFFGDWQPQKSTDTWLDLASNSSGVANDADG